MGLRLQRGCLQHINSMFALYDCFGEQCDWQGGGVACVAVDQLLLTNFHMVAHDCCLLTQRAGVC